MQPFNATHYVLALSLNSETLFRSTTEKLPTKSFYLSTSKPT